MLTNSFGTYNYLLNEDIGQYDLYAIPSQIMPFHSYPASLVNQNEIHIKSSSSTNHIVNEHDPYNKVFEIMSFTAILQVWWIKMKSLLSYHVYEFIWHKLWPWQAWRFWPIRIICDTIQANAMLQLSCKFGESKWNLYWLIWLTHLTLIMSLASIKMLTNMIHMEYHLS